MPEWAAGLWSAPEQAGEPESVPVQDSERRFAPKPGSAPEQWGEGLQPDSELCLEASLLFD